MKIDFHSHTIFSDGVETPERMVQRAKEIGLDGIAITDHNSIKGWKRAVEEGKRIGCKVVTGKEIKIREGGRTIGEILALFLNGDVDGNKLEDVGGIVDKIRQQDGIAAIAHPFDSWLKYSKSMTGWTSYLLSSSRKSPLLNFIEKEKIKLDAIEITNGRNVSGANEASKNYARKKKIAGIAGSDSHWAWEVGNCYTYSGANSFEEFKKDIKRGNVKVFHNQKSFLEINYHRAACWLLRRI